MKRWGSLVLMVLVVLAQSQMPVHGQAQNMTLEQKVGQLFLVTLYSTNLDQADRNFMAATYPGGVVLFPHNIQSPEQVTQLTNALQQYNIEIGVNVPMIIAVDQEGGVVTRLDAGFTRFPSELLIGATNNETDAMLIGTAMGEEMKAVGINMNLAPVTDLYYPNGADRGNVLYRRVFGQSPEMVGRLAGGVINGLQAANVIGVLKHFPGHGAATTDSHSDLPIVTQTREEINASTLIAFQGAINSGAGAIMTGHLYYPALDPGFTRPATLSPVILNTILREQMGFQGVIISDAMDMGAIRQNYGLGPAVIQAINAGVDLIAFGPHLTLAEQQSVIQATVEAARTGAIPAERLDDAVNRAIQLRQDYGLMNWVPQDVATASTRLNLSGHQEIVREVAQDAITVLDNSRNMLPLNTNQRILLIYPTDYADVSSACAAYDFDVQAYSVTYYPSAAEISTAVSMAQNAEIVIVFVEDTMINAQQNALAYALPPEKTIAVSMRGVDDWTQLPGPMSTIVLAYDSLPTVRAAVCDVLYGAAPAVGRVPVPIGPYSAGDGVDVVR